MLTDYQHDLIPVIYTIIFFFGFIGNSLIITVLCFQGGTKTIANIYILNLAIADLLSLSTLPFWATYYALGFNWLFGKVMCKISSSLLCLNLFASIFLISCMSVDRYVAIVYPLRSQRRTSHQAFIVVFMVWGLAIMSTLPTFYFRNMYYIGNLGVNACVMDFPEEEYTNWFVAISYMKISFGFCFPLAVIGTCYLMIASHLKKPKGLLLNNQNRDRVLKIVTAIVLAFIVCWLPFHLLTFLDTLLRMEILTNCKLVTVLDTAMPFSICMGFFNSCINPFLYCFVGNQFRENFRHLFTSHHDNSRQNSSRKGSDSAWANDNVKV
ncbi:type-2 angiotensin II receptor [Discoglossus pictus]